MMLLKSQESSFRTKSAFRLQLSLYKKAISVAEMNTGLSNKSFFVEGFIQFFQFKSNFNLISISVFIFNADKPVNSAYFKPKAKM